MADRTKNMANSNPSKPAPVFWASTAKCNSAQQEAVVPGVNTVGNMRPRVKGGKTKEVRAYVPIKQPVVETTNSHGTKTSVGMMSDISTIDTDLSALKAKQVSLRDLCVEDKKRVANLIKELARVVEEKENAEQNLASERHHYQDQILKLVEQQESVLKEREDVQKKLLEYQNHIVKLQQSQQLHHLQQQRERQRKFQSKDLGKESRSENHHVPSKGAKDEKNVQSRRAIITQPVSDERNTSELQPRQDLQIWYKKEAEMEDDDGSSEEEGEGNETPVEQPSQNIYMNQLDESDVNEFSTRALPALSPQPSGHDRPRPKFALYRPFTAMIDQELAKQQAALETAEEVITQSHHTKAALDKGHAQDSDVFDSCGFSNDKLSSKLKSVSPQRLRENVREKKSRIMRQNEGEEEEEEILTKASHPNYALSSQSLVSPEKAEIMNRFMRSQAHNHHYDGEHHEHTGKETKDTMKTNEKHSGLQERKGHKRKKRPPPCFGGFHPPVMSSTQKSSEIGDYVNSTINSDRRMAATLKEHQPGHHDNANEEGSDKMLEREDGMEDKGVNVQARRSKSKPRSKVEFSNQLVSGDDLQSDPLISNSHPGHPDYLSYYKNLSASDRKKELLKQRFMLMEEQNKLKKILAKQESNFMMKQTESMAKTGTVRDLDGDDVDNQTMKRMQDSLEEMELRLAQKEESLRKERELLQQKRKEKTVDCDLQERINSETYTVIVAGNGSTTKSKAGKEESKEQRASSKGVKDENPPTFDDNITNLTKFPQEKIKDVKTGVSPKLSKGIMSDGKALKETRNRQDDLRTKMTLESQRPDGTMDDVLVRRLDYSFRSDTDHDIAQDIDPEVVGSEDASDENKDKALSRSTDKYAKKDTPLNHGMVDAGTSMSFAHFSKSESDSHQRPDSMNVEKTRSSVAKSHPKARRRQPFSESPGEKTLAVIEIINSLDDLDEVRNPSVNTIPRSSARRAMGKQTTESGPKKVPWKKQHSAQVSTITSKQISNRQKVDTSTKIFPLAFHQSTLASAHKTHKLSHPLSNWPVRRRTMPGSQQTFAGHELGRSGHRAEEKDKELELFHLPQFKEERLDGFRRLANRDTDDSDISYNYDDNDNSNLDDIVDALSASFNEDCDLEGVKEGRRRVKVRDGEDEADDDNVWDAVVSDLNDVSSLKLPEDADADTSSLLDEYFDGLDLNCGRRKPDYADDSDILEEVFFVNL